MTRQEKRKFTRGSGNIKKRSETSASETFHNPPLRIAPSPTVPPTPEENFARFKFRYVRFPFSVPQFNSSREIFHRSPPALSPTPASFFMPPPPRPSATAFYRYPPLQLSAPHNTRSPDSTDVFSRFSLRTVSRRSLAFHFLFMGYDGHIFLLCRTTGSVCESDDNWKFIVHAENSSCRDPFGVCIGIINLTEIRWSERLPNGKNLRPAYIW
ncbi:hypothetical protein GWI33_009022 [Rhynchophorus ferrugineus]|uniref:Uncharacterized protein n=1 Tax=Rhynchophorus ferrugineus TaxID=354439 RepID=A0A834MBT0_RHYFE|nr:hypothetical protein GWI33_009022 [Rhynchophorus ferrugineus]